MPLESLIDDARGAIEVTDQELNEARDRRSKIASALRSAFPGSRIYVNGSIAHGDAITPLNGSPESIKPIFNSRRQMKGYVRETDN